MTSCLAPEVILSFGQGIVSTSRPSGADAHLADCEECRVLVAAMKRASLVDPSELSNEAAPAPASPPAPALADFSQHVDGAIGAASVVARVDVAVSRPTRDGLALRERRSTGARKPTRRITALAAVTLGVFVVVGIAVDVLALRVPATAEPLTVVVETAPSPARPAPSVAHARALADARK